MKNKTNIDIKTRPRHDGGVDLIIAVDGLGLELALSKVEANALVCDLIDAAREPGCTCLKLPFTGKVGCKVHDKNRSGTSSAL